MINITEPSRRRRLHTTATKRKPVSFADDRSSKTGKVRHRPRSRFVGRQPHFVQCFVPIRRRPKSFSEVVHKCPYLWTDMAAMGVDGINPKVTFGIRREYRTQRAAAQLLFDHKGRHQNQPDSRHRGGQQDIAIIGTEAAAYRNTPGSLPSLERPGTGRRQIPVAQAFVVPEIIGRFRYAAAAKFPGLPQTTPRDGASRRATRLESGRSAMRIARS